MYSVIRWYTTKVHTKKHPLETELDGTRVEYQELHLEAGLKPELFVSNNPEVGRHVNSAHCTLRPELSTSLDSLHKHMSSKLIEPN